MNGGDLEVLEPIDLSLDHAEDFDHEEICSVAHSAPSSHACDFEPNPLASPRSRDDPRGLEASSAFQSCELTGASFTLTLPSSSNRAFFENAFVSNAKFCDIKMPWETGVAQQIFGNPFHSTPVIPAVSTSEWVCVPWKDALDAVVDDTLRHTCETNSAPVFVSAVRNLDDKTYDEQRDALMDAAISKVLIVLRHCLLASVVGRQIISLGSEEQQLEVAKEIVSAVVGLRSPYTVVKRANSLLSFLRWCAKSKVLDTNPFSEKVVWQYFQDLKELGAPATRASSCMSAFRFALHVLGFESLSEVTGSRRVVGLSDQMHANKRVLRQALPLTVLQVRKLHDIATNSNANLVDRGAAVYFLIALYGRCRHSDLTKVHSVVPDFDDDGGFLEIRSAHHKTGKTAERRTQLMPILIPARGVHGVSWMGAASDVFSQLELSLDGPIGGPLFPAPSLGHETFCKRPLTSGEASSFLRMLIGAPSEAVDDSTPIVSSHSAKATLLSWAAKYGLSEPSRSILGRHASATSGAYAFYSRDLCVAPTREMQVVIDEIFKGNFNPDAPRSAYFTRCEPMIETESGSALMCAPEVGSLAKAEAVDSECVQSETQEEHEPIVVQDDSSSESSSSEAGSSADSSCGEEPPMKVKRFRPRVPRDESWYVHRRSHILHLLTENADGLTYRYLACGKRLTEAYSLSTEATAWNVMCKMCLKKKPS